MPGYRTQRVANRLCDTKSNNKDDPFANDVSMRAGRSQKIDRSSEE